MRFLSLAAFINQINFKNVTAFFTNTFKRKTALNKEHSFLHFAPVIYCLRLEIIMEQVIHE